MLKMFDRWACSEVKVADPGIAKYLGLEDMLIPHTFGTESGKGYTKKSINVVERLVNKLMRTGQGKKKLGGKFIRGRGYPANKLKVMKIVEDAFSIVEEKTKSNPIQQLATAIQNSSPREDVTRLKKGGVAYTESVDISPIRRLDEAIKNIALAAFATSFDNNKGAAEALAEEILLAAKNDNKSYAVRRKDEMERIAKSSR